MRILLTTLTVLAMVACSDDDGPAGPDTSTPAGTYTLVAAGDQDVPATFIEHRMDLEIISGSLTLTIEEDAEVREDAIGGEYTLRIRWGSTFEETETETFTGIWGMLEDDDQVDFSSSQGSGVPGDYEPGRIVDLAWQFGDFGYERLTFEK